MFNDPNTQSESELLSLMSSRICHDLINPIGAIQNGMELLDLAGIPKTEEIQMVEQSVQVAVARLEFFRIAFGAASASARLDGTDCGRKLRAAINKRIALDWQITGEHSRSRIKLIFLLFLCFETALPKGGEISVRNAASSWAISGRGEGARFSERLWQNLKEGKSLGELQPAQMQFHLVQQFLEERDVPCEWVFERDSARLIFEARFD